MKKDNKYKKINYKYTAKSLNQEKYVEYLNDIDSDIIIVTGPAGTGKTMFACLKAIHLLKDEHIDKLIITRPLVTVEEEMGFLPGDIVKKMDPWTKPIFDLFLEYYSKKELDSMIENNIIEIAPLAFMRGRTFKNSFIIADEMQNSSPNQMKMLTPRIGINTRMVITGDLKQSDLVFDNNGLNDILNKIKYYQKKTKTNDFIKFLELENEDIERSRIVKKVIEIYDFKETKITNEFYNSYSFDKTYEEIEETVKELEENFEKLEKIKKIEEKLEESKNTEELEKIVEEMEKLDKNIVDKNIVNKNIVNKNNDCALIPKHLLSKYLIKNENDNFFGSYYC